MLTLPRAVAEAASPSIAACHNAVQHQTMPFAKAQRWFPFWHIQGNAWLNALWSAMRHLLLFPRVLRTLDQHGGLATLLRKPVLSSHAIELHKETLPRLWGKTVGPGSVFFVEVVVPLGKIQA